MRGFSVSAIEVASVTKVALNELIAISDREGQPFLSYLLRIARDECDVMLKTPAKYN